MQPVAPTLPSRTKGGGGLGTDFDCDGGLIHAPEIARCVATREGTSQDWETTTMVAHSLRADGFDASEDGTGRGTPLVPVGFNARQDPDYWNDRTGPLDTFSTGPLDTFSTHATAFAQNQRDEVREMEVAGTLASEPGMKQQTYLAFKPIADALTAAYGTKWNGNASADNGSLFAQQSMQVRRLTPRECERLQGFPDDYTLVEYRNKPAADGPRYKALGNSMAVPVMRWIGERIQFQELL